MQVWFTPETIRMRYCDKKSPELPWQFRGSFLPVAVLVELGAEDDHKTTGMLFAMAEARREII